MVTKVRHADAEDIHDIMSLALEMHAESARFSRFSFDYDKLQALILQLIDTPTGCVLIASVDGMPVGMLVNLVSEHFFSRDKISTDLGFFVTQDHRGSSIGLKMIQKLEDWANSHAVKEINLEVNTGVSAERTTQFLERIGYKLMGYWLVKQGGDKCA